MIGYDVVQSFVFMNDERYLNTPSKLIDLMITHRVYQVYSINDEPHRHVNRRDFK